MAYFPGKDMTAGHGLVSRDDANVKCQSIPTTGRLGILFFLEICTIIERGEGNWPGRDAAALSSTQTETTERR